MDVRTRIANNVYMRDLYMSTMNGSLSARQRKSLADQIDRLDGILDGLADALNGAVADAVKEAVGTAVKEAVQAVLREVLTNPQLTRAVADAHRPVAAPAEPKPATRLVTAAKRVLFAVSVAGGWVFARAKTAVRFTGRTAATMVSKAGACVRNTRTAVSVVAAFAGLTRRRVLVAAAVGVSVAVGCYLAGPVVASAACGLAASAASVTAGLVRTLWPVPNWYLGAQEVQSPLD